MSYRVMGSARDKAAVMAVSSKVEDVVSRVLDGKMEVVLKDGTVVSKSKMEVLVEKAVENEIANADFKSLLNLAKLKGELVENVNATQVNVSIVDSDLEKRGIE